MQAAKVASSAEASTSSGTRTMLDSSPSGAASPAPEVVRLYHGCIVPGTRYRLLRWLGEGGMGVVYEAEHIEIGRRVAVKILAAEHTRNPLALASFRDEARASATIGAPNIIDVHDFFTLPDGRVLAAMELLTGTDLSFVQQTPLEPGRAIGILRQLCQGLAAAHDAGIVHGDVKPENLFLIARNGRPDFLKILDFGVATMLGQGSDRTRRVGTAAYVSPEIVLDLPRGTKVDMYAAGCTAYEILTGRPPFEAEDLEELLRKHVTEEPVPPSRINPAVPPALEAVVLRMLAKNPDERFSDMRDLEAALCEAQIASRLTSGWDDLPLPEVEPKRRDALLRRMPDPYAAARGRRNRGLLAALGAAALLLVGVGAWGLSRGPEAAQLDDQVGRLVDDAREAAAMAYFVYPPKVDPRRATAYTKVLELEASDARGAREAAGQLRAQFSETLVRLGDDLWDREGGRSFALDYYLQALIFDPDNARARDRSQTTPGQLAGLTRRAAEMEFSDSELTAVEPLAVLANPDAAARSEQLVRLAEDEETVRPSSTRAELTMLVGELEGGSAAVELGDRAEADELPVAEGTDTGRPPPASALDATEGGAQEPDEATHPPVADEALDDTTRLRDVKQLVHDAESAVARRALGEAEQLYNRALAKDSGNVAALRGLGQLAFDAGEYSTAVAYRKRAARRAPGSGRVQLELGDAYFKVLRYDDALAHYERAGQLEVPEAKARIDKVRAKLGR